MNYPDDAFDLILNDFSSPCMTPFVHKFKYPPMAIVTAFTNPPCLSLAMGNHHYYSYAPHVFLNLNEEMIFWERVYNFVFHIEEIL